MKLLLFNKEKVEKAVAAYRQTYTNGPSGSLFMKLLLQNASCILPS